MADIETAIKNQEEIIQFIRSVDFFRGSIDEQHLERKANTVLELLKEQKPRVLTYDEMKAMIGEPVFVEEPKRNACPRCHWGLVVEGVTPPIDGGYIYPGGVDFNVEVGLDTYDGDLYMIDIGCGWRAWNKKPTDEERMNTPWEERSIKPDCPYVTNGKCIGKNACDLEEKCVFKKDGEQK